MNQAVYFCALSKNMDRFNSELSGREAHFIAKAKQFKNNPNLWAGIEWQVQEELWRTKPDWES